MVHGRCAGHDEASLQRRKSCPWNELRRFDGHVAWLQVALLSEYPVPRDVLGGQRAQNGFQVRLQRRLPAIRTAVGRQCPVGTNRLEGRGGGRKPLAVLIVTAKRGRGGTSPASSARLPVPIVRCAVIFAAHWVLSKIPWDLVLTVCWISFYQLTPPAGAAVSGK